jgi:hypothetical protein
MRAAEGCGDALPSRGGAPRLRVCGCVRVLSGAMYFVPLRRLIVLTQERTKRVVCAAGRRRVGKRRKAGGGRVGERTGCCARAAVAGADGAHGVHGGWGLSTSLGSPSW